jgi:hypothetical protein
MTGPREVRSETQQFQSRLDSNLPRQNSFAEFLEREKIFTRSHTSISELIKFRKQLLFPVYLHVCAKIYRFSSQ